MKTMDRKKNTQIKDRMMNLYSTEIGLYAAICTLEYIHLIKRLLITAEKHFHHILSS